MEEYGDILEFDRDGLGENLAIIFVILVYARRIWMFDINEKEDGELPVASEPGLGDG
jgi:hypothetical protein